VGCRSFRKVRSEVFKQAYAASVCKAGWRRSRPPLERQTRRVCRRRRTAPPTPSVASTAAGRPSTPATAEGRPKFRYVRRFAVAGAVSAAQPSAARRPSCVPQHRVIASARPATFRADTQRRVLPSFNAKRSSSSPARKHRPGEFHQFRRRREPRGTTVTAPRVHSRNHDR